MCAAPRGSAAAVCAAVIAAAGRCHNWQCELPLRTVAIPARLAHSSFQRCSSPSTSPPGAQLERHRPAPQHRGEPARGPRHGRSVSSWPASLPACGARGGNPTALFLRCLLTNVSPNGPPKGPLRAMSGYVAWPEPDAEPLPRSAAAADRAAPSLKAPAYHYYSLALVMVLAGCTGPSFFRLMGPGPSGGGPRHRGGGR
jgi:hypothetical protein